MGVVDAPGYVQKGQEQIMPDFFGESEDFMRVMMPNGTLVTVEKAIPVNELRISFNGREMRLCE